MCFSKLPELCGFVTLLRKTFSKVPYFLPPPTPPLVCLDTRFMFFHAQAQVYPRSSTFSCFHISLGVTDAHALPNQWMFRLSLRIVLITDTG